MLSAHVLSSLCLLVVWDISKGTGNPPETWRLCQLAGQHSFVIMNHFPQPPLQTVSTMTSLRAGKDWMGSEQ